MRGGNAVTQTHTHTHTIDSFKRPFANRTSLSDKAKNKARFMLIKIKRIMESK